MLDMRLHLLCASQVLLISFISPAFWSKILKPGTKRDQYLRFCMRFFINSLNAIL